MQIALLFDIDHRQREKSTYACLSRGKCYNLSLIGLFLLLCYPSANKIDDVPAKRTNCTVKKRSSNLSESKRYVVSTRFARWWQLIDHYWTPFASTRSPSPAECSQWQAQCVVETLLVLRKVLFGRVRRYFEITGMKKHRHSTLIHGSA